MGHYEFVKWQTQEGNEKEYCFTIASFDIKKRDEEPDLKWVGKRPLDLQEFEFEIFMELVRTSYDIIEMDFKLNSLAEMHEMYKDEYEI